MLLKTVVICTDGSEVATRAALAGFAILQPAERVVVAAVVDDEDEMAFTGTGMAGGVMTPGEVAGLAQASDERAQAIVDRTAGLLASANTETQVLQGDPGPTLCRLAGELPANALVLGSRGHGRIKRVLLGSVSDYVVRNAPCPVVITGPD